MSSFLVVFVWSLCGAGRRGDIHFYLAFSKHLHLISFNFLWFYVYSMVGSLGWGQRWLTSWLVFIFHFEKINIVISAINERILQIEKKHISSSLTVNGVIVTQGGQCRGQYLYLILTNVRIIQICPPRAQAIRLNVSHLALIHPSSSRKCPIILISFRRGGNSHFIKSIDNKKTGIASFVKIFMA